MDTVLFNIDLKKRFILTKESSFYLYKFLFISVLLVLIISGIAYLNFSNTQLLVFAGSLLLFSFLVYKTIKKIATFSIQNDVVIVEPMHSKVHIVPVEMVRMAKSINVFGIKYTRLKFRLDGVSCCYIGLGMSNKLKEKNVNVDQLIDTLKEIKKGKS